MNVKHFENELSFEVLEQPIYLPDGSQIKSKKALVNSDNGAPIEVVGQGYRTFTNAEFNELAGAVCDNLGLDLKHFTSINNGKKILAVFSQPETKLQIGDWTVSNYPVLINGNGGSALKFGSSNVLHRCANMFASTKSNFSIAHTASLDARLNGVKKALEQHGKELQIFFDEIAALETKKVSDKAVTDAIKMLLNIKSQEKIAELSTRKYNLYECLTDCMSREIGKLGRTAFGIYNGVTYYTTHFKDSAETMAMHGNVATLNKKALEYCKALN